VPSCTTSCRLIAEAEHGTFYGVMGQRSPQPAELKALQDACAGDMNMMRHCRQCRADAVGLLGEDRGAEFTLDKIEAMEIDYEAAMVVRAELRDADRRRTGREARQSTRAGCRDNTAGDQDPAARRRNRRRRSAGSVLMAVAAKNGLVAVHFGHAREFLVYEASADWRPPGRSPQGGVLLRR
jgi:nitrogen fixation protein NifB